MTHYHRGDDPPGRWVADPGDIGRQIVDHYEDLAERFRRDTRITAPGKDRAPAEGDDGISERDRMERWRDWLAEQNEGPPDWRSE